ncbi:MAG: hypothetical protein QOJ51_7178, partial [Acidobacteriaceae bacterium]|nr:hypothetical protein [Acidobacteriaceae bacterium]
MHVRKGLRKGNYEKLVALLLTGTPGCILHGGDSRKEVRRCTVGPFVHAELRILSTMIGLPAITVTTALLQGGFCPRKSGSLSESVPLLVVGRLSLLKVRLMTGRYAHDCRNE